LQETPFRILIFLPKAHLQRVFILKTAIMTDVDKISMEVVNPGAAGIDIGSRSH